jgi:hypothetical protein
LVVLSDRQIETKERGDGWQSFGIQAERQARLREGDKKDEAAN